MTIKEFIPLKKLPVGFESVATRHLRMEDGNVLVVGKFENIYKESKWVILVNSTPMLEAIPEDGADDSDPKEFSKLILSDILEFCEWKKNKEGKNV